IAAGRALALLRGRTYVLPQDVFDVAPDILRHRIVLSYEALAQDIGVDDVLSRLLSTVPAPRVAPSQDHSARHVGATSIAAHHDAPAPQGSTSIVTSVPGALPPPPGSSPWSAPAAGGDEPTGTDPGGTWAPGR